MTLNYFPKSKSWTTLICELEIGPELNFPAHKAESIRALISGRIKKKFPLLTFSAIVTGEYIVVKRTK